MEAPYDWRTMIAAIIAFVLGLALILWTAHAVLTFIGWALVIGAAIWLLVHLFGNKTGSRTDL
jgi:predicted PurR-regulated permease PerM